MIDLDVDEDKVLDVKSKVFGMPVKRLIPKIFHLRFKDDTSRCGS
jgi:hypothetical protein